MDKDLSAELDRAIKDSEAQHPEEGNLSYLPEIRKELLNIVSEINYLNVIGYKISPIKPPSIEEVESGNLYREFQKGPYRANLLIDFQITGESWNVTIATHKIMAERTEWGSAGTYRVNDTAQEKKYLGRARRGELKSLLPKLFLALAPVLSKTKNPSEIAQSEI